MSFYTGFDKLAAGKGDWVGKAWGKTKEIAGKAKEIGKGALEGLKATENQKLWDVAKMKHVSHLGDAAKAQGGWAKAFKSGKGRKAMGEALGKATPSLAAGGAYLYGGKKLYDKTLGAPSESKEQNQYMSNYYVG